MTSPRQRETQAMSIGGSFFTAAAFAAQPSTDAVLGGPARPARRQRGRIEAAPLHRLGQRVERQPRGARQRHVRGEATDRIAREERIVADWITRVSGRGLFVRNHGASDSITRIASASARCGPVRRQQTVMLREVHVGVELIEHPRAQPLGEPDQGRDGPGSRPRPSRR